MAVGSVPASDFPTVTRPDLGLAGKVTIALLVLLGLGALAGGLALLVRPDGSAMGFDVALLAGSPFPDYVVPGLILGGLFGMGSLTVAALGVRRARSAPFLAFAIGCGQMIWIVVELAIIREYSFLQPVCFGIGLAIAVASAVWGWPTLQEWRGRR